LLVDKVCTILTFFVTKPLFYTEFKQQTVFNTTRTSMTDMLLYGNKRIDWVSIGVQLEQLPASDVLWDDVS